MCVTRHYSTRSALLDLRASIGVTRVQSRQVRGVGMESFLSLSPSCRGAGTRDTLLLGDKSDEEVIN